MPPTASDAAAYLTRIGRDDLASAVHLALAELAHHRSRERTNAAHQQDCVPIDEEVQRYLKSLPDEEDDSGDGR